jgi:hypothetical protein
MKKAMALATKVECDKKSNGFGGKSNGNKGGRQLMATRAMGDNVGDGNSDEAGGQQRGQG